jgi:hypothetical protein
MTRKWRSKPQKHLATRAISKEEIPALIEAMREDGLMAIITSEGVRWYLGDYSLLKSVVREVWGLSPKQMVRIDNYIYGNDPFINTESGN